MSAIHNKNGQLSKRFFNLKPIPLSIKLAFTTILSLGVTAIGASNASAQTDDIEHIQITGSRILQVDMETVSPVSVISAKDIAMSGESNVADVLNNAAINSFGSWRGATGYASGDSASSSVNLRGLGASATLVLLDGRRMPGTTSSSGAIADTSQIPLAIVERIEILRDGASAIYGSDAVAGVVNIITKKDFDGVEVDFTTEYPQMGSGDIQQLSIAAGLNTDNGNITFTYERYQSAEVLDRDVWKMDDPSYDDYSFYSSVPNGDYYDYDLDDLVGISNSELCQQASNTLDETDGMNNGYCRYNYGADSTLHGDVTRDAFLSNFSFEISDNLSFKGRASATLMETGGRTAATPVSTNYMYMGWDNSFNPVGEDIDLYMRSEQLGARDEKVDTETYDILAGLVGYWDITNGIDWEINAQYSNSKTEVIGYNLINDLILQQQIDAVDDNGQSLYDIFNVTGMSFEQWDAQMTNMYTAAQHTSVYHGEFDSTQIDGLLSTLLFENEMVALSGVVGFEYEKINFTQDNDAESSLGIISGGAGGDNVDANRDRTAGFIELQMGLPANIELSAAMRYERYDQDGLVTRTDQDPAVESATFDAVVPKFGVSWRPTDDVLLRASYGESFRAPNMIEMFASDSFGFVGGYDAVWCGENGDEADPYYCSYSAEHLTWFGGNPDLEAEEGDSLTFGGVWNVTSQWSVELSYYSINYDNKIETMDISDILYNEQINGGSDVVNRDEYGQVISVESEMRNLASVETSGVDFITSYELVTEIGDINFSVDMSHVLEYTQQSESGDIAVDYAGSQDYPDWRGNFSVDWQYDVFSASWATMYIGSQSAQMWRDEGYEDIIDTPSYFKHNLQFGYQHGFDGSITLGVNNLPDEQAPSWYSFAGYQDVNTDLYDVIGRSYYLRINQQF